MKKLYLTLLILALSLTYSLASSYAAILKNPFNKQPKQKQTKIQSESVIQDNTLKAKAIYLELEGDNVEYDHEKNLYITYGMSIAHIVDQDAHLEADSIIYYGDDQHIEAIGNIKITRQNIVTVGESFKFDATSNKYLLTRPHTTLSGAVIKARTVSSTSDDQL